MSPCAEWRIGLELLIGRYRIVASANAREVVRRSGKTGSIISEEDGSALSSNARGTSASIAGRTVPRRCSGGPGLFFGWMKSLTLMFGEKMR